MRCKQNYKYRLMLNPYHRLMSKFDNISNGVNVVKRELPIIVSISSTEENFKDLELSLYSLFTQKVLPDRVVLWLNSRNELSELPYEITKYIKHGLEIRFVKNLSDYSGAEASLREFSNYIVVTANDNVYYPSGWLKNLYHSYISSPEDIQVHCAMRVKNNNLEIMSHKTWDRHVKGETSEYKNFMVSEGGILFPPNCFSKEFFREDIYRNIPNYDIWLWFMALLSNRKIRIVKNHIDTLQIINIFRLFSEKQADYDAQIKFLMQYYGQNIIYKLK